MKHIDVLTQLLMILRLSNKIGYVQCPWGYLQYGTYYNSTVNTGIVNYASITMENYHYSVEVSHNRFNVVNIGSSVKNKSEDHIYKYHNSATGNDYRIKQVYSNRYTHLTGIKSIHQGSTTLLRLGIYLNPTSGCGIKFDDIQSGKN